MHLTGLLDRLQPVGRLTDHLEIGLAGEEETKPGAHHGQVVGDDDRIGISGDPLSGVAR